MSQHDRHAPSHPEPRWETQPAGQEHRRSPLGEIEHGHDAAGQTAYLQHDVVGAGVAAAHSADVKAAPQPPGDVGE